MAVWSAEAWHLIRRFGGALWPVGPGDEDERWVTQALSPAELGLWTQMSAADRRHSVAVGRRVADARAPTGSQTSTLLAAALLHDVGKLRAGLGTFARVVATVIGLIFGHSHVASWADRRGLAGRIGRYLAHDQLGAELLASAGSHHLVVAWAAEHHLPSSDWSVPAEIGAILKTADND